MKEKPKKKDNNIRKTPLIEFNKIVSYIQKLLFKKYYISKTTYQKYLIKNIIYDDKTRLVAIFKEQLIINDTSEYMKRFYNNEESVVRLKKYFDIYEEFSKIFPNYTPLSEAKYIYTNIHKKQKIIDLQQDQDNLKQKLKNRFKNFNKLRNNKIFSNDVYESIEKNSENINTEIFGIKKDESNNSISKINNIIERIDRFELNLVNIEFNSNNKNEKNTKNKNIIINNYYYNNNSIIAKKIQLDSILFQPKNSFLKSKNFPIIKNNILTNLKKTKVSFNSHINSSSKLNKTKQNKKENINNIKYKVFGNVFNKNNSNKENNRNKSVSNTNKTNKFSNYFAKNKKQKGQNIKCSYVIPFTSRISNYQNMKLNSIIKNLVKTDINNSLSIKQGNQSNKNKIKINRSLIGQIIYDKTPNILTERKEINIDSHKKRESSKNRTVINQKNMNNRKNKSDYFDLKIYLETIKKKDNKKTLYNKASYNTNKNSKINTGLKTDRGIDHLKNLKQIIKKKPIIKRQFTKKINMDKKPININNYISGSFLTNGNIIKNKHNRITSKNTAGNSSKYLSININDIHNKKNNNSKIGSKIKIKGIQIKNFNRVFKISKEKNKGIYLKTSEKRTKISTKFPKNIKKILCK